MDTTKPTENDGQYLPALWKIGAGEAELKALCNQYEACVAVDWGNANTASTLRFSSAAALDPINEPGWEKWSGGCQSGCFPNGAGDGGDHVCHVKCVAGTYKAITGTEACDECPANSVPPSGPV